VEADPPHVWNGCVAAAIRNQWDAQSRKNKACRYADRKELGKQQTPLRTFT
jgi:hypothetical protein